MTSAPRKRPRRTSSRFPLGVDLGLGAALGIFLAATLAAYRLSGAAAASAAEARNAVESLADLQELLTSVLDAEAGQRGYLLTGDERMLEPYRAAAPRIEERLAQLSEGLAREAGPATGTKALGLAVRAKLAELEETVRLGREGRRDAALEIVSSGRGRREMERLRECARGLERELRSRLRDRDAAAGARLETARRVVVGGVLVDLFVLLAVSRVTHREARDRGRAEEALAAAHAEVQEVLDASTRVAIVATDLQGRVTVFNRGAESLLGYRSEEVVGRTSLLSFHLPAEIGERGQELAATRGEPLQGLDAVLAPARRGLADERDWTYVRKNGERVRVAQTVTLKRDREGQPSGYLVVARDVSDRQKVARRQAAQHAASKALGESVTVEDAIPRVLEAMGRALGFDVAGFWMVDEAAGVLRAFSFWRASDKFHAFEAAGQDLALAPGQDLPGRVWQGKSPLWRTDVCAEGGSPRGASARAVGLQVGFACPAGLAGDVQGVLEFYTAAREEEDPHLLEVFQGIGAQIGQFMERDAADRARRAGDERTKAVIENMLEGLVVVDEGSVIVSVNPAAERMFGYESWELLGQPLSLLTPTPARGSAAASFLREARLRSLGRITEWRGRRKSGELFPFELALYELTTPEGRLFAGNVRDISERWRLDRMQSEFVANVSHELRTPLTSIRGSLGLLASGALGTLPDEAVDLIAIAERNTVRLITLINDILDLERLQAGRLEIHLAPVSLATVVGRGLEAVQAFAEERGVAVSADVGGLAVLGDAERLVQVLVNLLANAVKFSNEGGAVRVSAAEVGASFEVRVADEGRGIPPDAMAGLFQRFHQVEGSDTREKGGTGLGLAICKAIVEQHGGQIGVESVPGKGSTFWFRVPKAEGARPPAPAEAAEETPAETAAMAPPPTRDSLLETLRGDQPSGGQADVLIVDDDQALLGVLARQFLSAGVGVRVASGATEAVHKARARAPGLLVLDLGLPEGSGYEVVAAMREDASLMDTPLLVYTGLDLGSEDRRRLRLGRTRFLTKSRATDREFQQVALELLGLEPPPGGRG